MWGHQGVPQVTILVTNTRSCLKDNKGFIRKVRESSTEKFYAMEEISVLLNK